MDIYKEILYDVIDRWNRKFISRLTYSEIDIIDLAIRIAYERAYNDIKDNYSETRDNILGQCRIASDCKTNKNVVNLSTLEFILKKNLKLTL